MNRPLIAVLLLASTAAGLAAGVLVAQLGQPNDASQDANSITGVRSGADGSNDKPPEEEGVDQVALPPEPPPEDTTTDPQSVDIEGVEGTEGVDAEPEITAEIVTSNDGTMQSIRGIKGIDTVMLQNLEAVLRMQAPPPPPEEGGGGGRAAAVLLNMETDLPPDPEQEIDGRDELTDQLEGS